jgi:hypothetical protein
MLIFRHYFDATLPLFSLLFRHYACHYADDSAIAAFITPLLLITLMLTLFQLYAILAITPDYAIS